QVAKRRWKAARCTLPVVAPIYIWDHVNKRPTNGGYTASRPADGTNAVAAGGATRGTRPATRSQSRCPGEISAGPSAIGEDVPFFAPTPSSARWTGNTESSCTE